MVEGGKPSTRARAATLLRKRTASGQRDMKKIAAAQAFLDDFAFNAARVVIG
jgi:hypothetical protein